MATRIFHTTKYRFLAVGLSALFMIAGILAFVILGGFNLGIDFQSGFSQKFQIAQPGLTLTNAGKDVVTVDVVSGNVSVSVRSTERGIVYHEFTTAEYPTIAALASAISGKIQGVTATAVAPQAPTTDIITGFGLPAVIGAAPFTLSSANSDTSDFVTIDEVRNAIGQTAQVQIVGDAYKQIFQIRLGNDSGTTQEQLSEQVGNALKNAFGQDRIVILQTDFVGPKFSASLVAGSILSVLVAVALILVYVWFRFKISYALAAIITLAHDTLALVAFIVIFQLEVSSTTIAALLTIIGYSLNNVIVIFDRIRENRRIIKDVDLLTMIDTSVSQSLSRTIFSSLTTVLAILPLAILASGAIELFAIEMVFGVAVGAYSSNMLAPALLYWITKNKGLAAPKAVAAGSTEKEEEEQAASVVSADLEIPSVERKLRGKRQEKK